jgi:DNA-binding SARP family transcriptional activator
MSISVLGSFEVINNGRNITPSAPKLRRTFALLAIRANRVLSVDQFIEELWQGRPPTSAMTTLQTYIYQTRKLLGLEARSPEADAASGEVMLRTQRGGYMLTVEPELLDLYRFEELLAHGYQQIDAGETTKGVDTLDAALGVWRGPALADIRPGPVLGSEIVRLEEQRKLALERRFDAQLRLGRHNELLAELSAIVSQQPTHEGFGAKLMIALYRSGRRRDALDVYRRVRNVLAEELGVEPSAELQQLHMAILTGGPELAAPVQPAEQVRVRKQGRPARAEEVAAAIAIRPNEFAEVSAAFSAREPGVLVVGGPGSGKSTFAHQVMERSRGSFPDGQFAVRLVTPDGAPVEPEDVPSVLLKVVGEPVADGVPAWERRWAFRRWVARRNALLVLDDIVSSSQLRPILQPDSACTVLAVSRRRIYHPAIRRTVDMRPIDSATASDLLEALVGEQRVRREPESVRRLVQMCDGSLLALRAAAAKLQLRPHWSIGHLADRLGRRHGSLDELAVEGMNLRASVRANLELLPEQYREQVCDLAVADVGSLTPEHVSRILEMDKSSAEDLLEELAEFQLLEVVIPRQRDGQATNGNGTGFQYRFRSLVRRAIKELAAPAGELAGVACGVSER